MKNPTPKEYRDNFEPFVYPTINKIQLNRDFETPQINFLEVILSRRSTNDLSHISIEELSQLLYYCTRINELEIDSYGFITSKRIVPSAGARHPIDLLISESPNKNDRCLSYYNPLDHSLNKLLLPEKELNSFFNEVDTNVSIKEACLIWFSIQKNKTSSKYENPESLYWRDAGALLYCIQLISTYLNLKSCPLGTLAANSFNQLLDSNCLLSGGGILIGK